MFVLRKDFLSPFIIIYPFIPLLKSSSNKLLIKWIQKKNFLFVNIWFWNFSENFFFIKLQQSLLKKFSPSLFHTTKKRRKIWKSDWIESKYLGTLENLTELLNGLSAKKLSVPYKGASRGAFSKKRLKNPSGFFWKQRIGNGSSSPK